MSQDDDDGDLMSRLQTGNDGALDVLMHRWQVPVRRFAERHLQNAAEAADVAQDTFVRVYRHRQQFRTGSQFSTWLFSIALNLCRDRARRSRTRPVEYLDEVHLAEASEEQGAENRGAGPHVVLMRHETATAVRAAVEALPEPLKTAVLLCEFQDLSHADAATISHCTPKAVETRLYRAREQLRKALARYF
ncbi:MAG: RNA polymerase sigma factor [Opitutaceae bacterium]